MREGPLALRGVGARRGGGWREGGGLRRGGRRALGAPRHGQRVPAGTLGDPEGGLWWQGHAWGRVRCAHAPAGVRVGACAGGTGACTYMAGVCKSVHGSHASMRLERACTCTHVSQSGTCVQTHPVWHAHLHRCAWSLYTPPQTHMHGSGMSVTHIHRPDTHGSGKHICTHVYGPGTDVALTRAHARAWTWSEYPHTCREHTHMHMCTRACACLWQSCTRRCV